MFRKVAGILIWHLTVAKFAKKKANISSNRE